jgi:hypothetical protein
MGAYVGQVFNLTDPAWSRKIPKDREHPKYPYPERTRGGKCEGPTKCVGQAPQSAWDKPAGAGRYVSCGPRFHPKQAHEVIRQGHERMALRESRGDRTCRVQSSPGRDILTTWGQVSRPADCPDFGAARGRRVTFSKRWLRGGSWRRPWFVLRSISFVVVL